jgi:hypothetical protein
VPRDCCTCASHVECLEADYECDLVAGRCAQARAPEPRCSMPFDPGDCGGSLKVFAFVDGRCQERAGTCQPEGNDNWFRSLEECLWRCEGLPREGECPEGRVPGRACLACGSGGGCSKEALVCVRTCEETKDCGLGTDRAQVRSSGALRLGCSHDASDLISGKRPLCFRCATPLIWAHIGHAAWKKTCSR